ncbi:MAG: hypothetical protein FWC09_01295 [Lachnospiraceae bacterium]|nr:hypothetical protein [Lachnospiraceae bacterium]
MISVGFGGSGHDFSTCIIENDQVLSFIEDERILRKKHSFFEGMGQALMKMPAINYCTKVARLDDVIPDCVVANNSLEQYYYARYKYKNQIHFIGHHLSHAASAFFPSTFEESAVLILDGAGFADEKGMNDSTSLWHGNKNEITKIKSHGAKVLSRKLFDNMIDVAENSIGVFYHIITHIIGFGLFEEGKTMGLAPYGTNKLYNQIRSFIDYGAEGSFLFSLDGIKELFAYAKTQNLEDFDVRANFAWAAQKIVEDAVIHSALYLKNQTNTDNICIAGGVALNSVANYKLYKTGLFKNYFIQPAAGDNGTSIGAAYYGAYCIGKIKRKYTE